MSQRMLEHFISRIITEASLVSQLKALLQQFCNKFSTQDKHFSAPTSDDYRLSITIYDKARRVLCTYIYAYFDSINIMIYDEEDLIETPYSISVERFKMFINIAQDIDEFEVLVIQDAHKR